MLTNPLRSSPSPLSQTFTGPVDYSQQLPVMLGSMVAPGTPVFNHSIPQPPLHFYQQGIRGRRSETDVEALRSQLLDEFRANKSRKWELRVRSICKKVLLGPYLPLTGHFWIRG